MSRRFRAGGEPAKTRRHKTAARKPDNAPKAVRRRSSSAAGQETEVVRLARELNEALERHTATTEILKIISASPTELQSVLEVVVKSAARFCEADDVSIFELDGQDIRSAAHWGPLPPLDIGVRFPCAGRIVLERRPIHIIDLQAEAEEFPEGSAFAKRLGHRTILGAPLLREGVAIGTIQLRRTEVRPFTDRQISLLETFAAQAVIAIENTRLLNELRQRTSDLTESLEQQTATADLLRVISSSPGDLTPVFTTILDKALDLCEAAFGVVTTYDGERFQGAAERGVPDALAAYFRTGMDQPRPGDAHWRLVAGEGLIHNLDQMDEDAYRLGNPLRRAVVDLGGARSALVVALRKDGALLGALTVYRKEVRPFTDKQIELVKNFAAQAVIAIENARLLNELRQRTSDLTESLDQQKATSEVLGVISSSPSELGPVFQSVLVNATRLCDATFGLLLLYEGDLRFRVVAMSNAPPAFAELRQREPVFEVSPQAGLGRAVATKDVVHIADYAEEPIYKEQRHPSAVVLGKLGGARTFLVVPMLKDKEIAGAIAIYRQEVRPFTEKQIALVQNFAAQAVIAIENTRLLNELRQSLQQQTATADVLKVISRSTFDLQTVLDTLVESATRLCVADRSGILLPEGDVYRQRANYGFAREGVEYALEHPLQVDRGSLTGRVVLEGRPIHISDVLADPEYRATDYQQAFGYRTCLGVPLLREGTTIGVFALTRDEVNPFTDKQIELVTTFADQAVIAIENARLFDEVQARTRELSQSVGELRALGEVSQAVNSTLDLETVLSTIVAKAVQLSGTEAGAIYGYDERAREFRLRATYWMDQALIDTLTQRHIGFDDPNVAGALAQREPTQVADLREEGASALNEIALRAGYRARMVAPLMRGEDIVGMLVVRRRKPGEFAKNTVDLIKTFAAQSALAIQNARLFHEIEDKSRQLEEASQHKSQFLANMSHELRTPLNAILGYTELMADGAYGEPSEKMLGILKRLEANGRHLLGLINDVLDLSKIEAGQLVLELSDYSIQDIAQTVRSTLEPLAADKKLAFKLELAPELPAGHGDGRRLTQVLINLVGNAIKFTDAGEVAKPKRIMTHSMCRCATPDPASPPPIRPGCSRSFSRLTMRSRVRRAVPAWGLPYRSASLRCTAAKSGSSHSLAKARRLRSSSRSSSSSKST